MFCKDNFNCCGRNELSWSKRGSRETRQKSDVLGQRGGAGDPVTVVDLESRHTETDWGFLEAELRGLADQLDVEN